MLIILLFIVVIVKLHFINNVMGYLRSLRIIFIVIFVRINIRIKRQNNKLNANFVELSILGHVDFHLNLLKENGSMLFVYLHLI